MTCENFISDFSTQQKTTKCILFHAAVTAAVNDDDDFWCLK